MDCGKLRLHWLHACIEEQLSDPNSFPTGQTDWRQELNISPEEEQLESLLVYCLKLGSGWVDWIEKIFFHKDGWVQRKS